MTKPNTNISWEEDFIESYYEALSSAGYRYDTDGCRVGVRHLLESIPKLLNKSQSDLIDQVVEWTEKEKTIPSNHPELELFAESCECSDCTFDVGYKRAINKVIDYLQGLKEKNV